MGNNTTAGKTDLVPTEYGNIFKDDYTIIMDPSPYLKHIIFEVPRRMPGNHIFLFRKGNAHASFNFKEFNIKANDLIMVPDNYIMYIDHFILYLFFHYTFNLNILIYFFFLKKRIKK